MISANRYANCNRIYGYWNLYKLTFIILKTLYETDKHKKKVTVATGTWTGIL